MVFERNIILKLKMTKTISLKQTKDVLRKNCFHSHEREFQSGIQGPIGSVRTVLRLSKLPIRDFLRSPFLSQDNIVDQESLVGVTQVVARHRRTINLIFQFLMILVRFEPLRANLRIFGLSPSRSLISKISGPCLFQVRWRYRTNWFVPTGLVLAYLIPIA